MTLAEIGRQMGLSREYIRQLRHAGLALLRLPALSIQLCSLCEQDSRQHYRQTRPLHPSRLRRRRSGR